MHKRKNHKKSTFLNDWVISVLGIFTFLFASCNLEKENKITDSDLLHVKAISLCDSIMVDTIFQKHNKLNWLKTNPKSIVEAVLHLDSMTNDYLKHLLKTCEPVEFHFSLGLGLRNEWIHNGEKELNDQVFNKLNLEHSDYASGLILELFHEFLKEGKINLVDSLSEEIKEDSMKMVRLEFQKIEDELNKIKKKNDG